ncbi:transposase from transposon Tn916 [Lachnospiraceae bacterium]|nr:transposase from transposon Tn916 [Lachnospiraceae bacterium]
MKVLFISSGEYKYGAPKSMMTLIKGLKDELNVEPILLTKRHSDLNDYCDRQGIENYSVWYRDIMAGSPYSHKLLTLMKHIVKSDKKTDLILGSPKTETSIRIIPIKSDILKTLQEIRQGYSLKDYILSGKSDKPIEPRNMQYYFKQLQIKAGIEPLCFHSLRHTFASVCIQSGMDVKTLSEILGHANVNTTLNYYVHSSIDQKLKQIESLSY